jgi:hypothetical protein
MARAAAGSEAGTIRTYDDEGAQDPTVPAGDVGRNVPAGGAERCRRG